MAQELTPNSLTLLNTRPSSAAAALDSLLQQNGMVSIPMPTLDIQYLPIELPNQRFDKCIVTSAQVLKSFKNFNKKLSPNMAHKFFAIGQATQIAMELAGVVCEPIQGQSFTSEALLADKSFSDLFGKNICILKGVGGRMHLKQTLVERGANVVEYECYQRRSSPFDHCLWNYFISSSFPVLLVSSLEAFQSIKDNVDEFSSLFATICFSDRIKKVLIENGLENIEVVETQSNQGVLQALQKLLK